MYIFVCGCFMAANIGLYFQVSRPLADEVYDEGDSLLFKRRGKEQRVALQDIIDIALSGKTFKNIDLRPLQTGPLGYKLSFMPPDKPESAAVSLKKELEKRVRRARKKFVQT